MKQERSTEPTEAYRGKKLLSATKRIKSLVDALERADSPAEILALCARITWQLRRICNLSK